MIDLHYASLTSRRVQHRVFYLDGHPSRYQPRPTGLNCGEQTGTGVFPLVIVVQLVSRKVNFKFKVLYFQTERCCGTKTSSKYSILDYLHDTVGKKIRKTSPF